MNAPLLIAVLAGFLLVGLSTGKTGSSRAEFFVAGRRGSTPAIAGSLFATVVGGSATIGVAGLVYERGLTGVWWSLVGAVGLAVLAFTLVRRIRDYGVYTLPGLVERLYGRKVSLLVGVLVVVAWTGVVSGQVVAAARVVGAAGLQDSADWMIAFSAVLIVYAIIGGQRAIIRTDMLQGALILIGLAAGTLFLYSRTGGTAVLGALPSGYLQFPVSDAFDWHDLFTMAVLVGSVYVVGPDIYTRVLSAKDGLVARRSVLWAAVLILPAAALVSLLGLAARALAPGIPAEQALPWLVLNELPGPLAIIVVVALLAALMSSADSTLLGQGVVLAEDVIGRVLPLDDRTAVLVSRVCIGVLGALSLLLALSLRGVISSLLFAYSVFTSGVVGPVLLGLVGGRKRPGAGAAFAGVLVGGAFGVAGALPFLSVPFKGELPLIGFGLSIIVPVVAGAMQRSGVRQEAMIE